MAKKEKKGEKEKKSTNKLKLKLEMAKLKSELKQDKKSKEKKKKGRKEGKEREEKLAGREERREEDKEIEQKPIELDNLKSESLDELVDFQSEDFGEIIEVQIQRIGSDVQDKEEHFKEVQRLEEAAETAQITQNAKKEDEKEKSISPYANLAAAAYQASNSPYQSRRVGESGRIKMDKGSEMFNGRIGEKDDMNRFRIGNDETNDDMYQNPNDEYELMAEKLDYTTHAEFGDKKGRIRKL